MTARRPPRLLLLAAFVVVLYYPLLFAPFNSLDDRKLVNFLINRDPLPISWHFFPGGVESYYRPLISLSYAFDEAAWGLEESFMHLENILVHLINVLLVFLAGRLLVRLLGLADWPASPWLPLVAAALFAVHPLNVEAVAWITARTDLLAGTFVLAALCALLAALQTGRLAWGVVAALSMGLGCLCKETTLFLLPGAGMLLLSRRLAMNGRGLTVFRRAVVFVLLLAMTGGYFLLRSQALAHDRGISITARVAQTASVSADPAVAALPDSPPAAAPGLAAWGRHVGTALTATGFYARKLVFPWPLNFAIDRVNPAWFWGGAAIWLAAVWLSWRRSLPAALLLTSLGIACSALIVSISPVAWTPLAERYMYVPLGPFVLGAVFWLGTHELSGRARQAVIVLLAAVISLFAATTLWRSWIWQDNLRLYQDTVSKSPGFAPARNELANMLAQRGRRDEGIAVLENVQLPDSQAASLGRADILAEKGDLEGARRFLNERLARTPTDTVEIMEQLIRVTHRMAEKTDDDQLKAGYYREILGWLVELERLTRNPFHWYRQGRIHLQLGDRENARRCFAEAARRFPVGSPYHSPSKELAKKLST